MFEVSESERMVRIVEDVRVRLGTKDTCFCPTCGLRRVIWPVGQNVNSWRDPMATWVHVNGLSECLLKQEAIKE